MQIERFLDHIYICIYDTMARQISIADDVYEKLTKRKGKNSFSETIRELLGEGKRQDLSEIAGILKGERNRKKLQKMIEKEREQNYGRKYEDW